MQNLDLYIDNEQLNRTYFVLDNCVFRIFLIDALVNLRISHFNRLKLFYLYYFINLYLRCRVDYSTRDEK